MNISRFFMLLFYAHSLCALTTLHVSLATDNDPGGMGENGDLRYCLNTMNVFLQNYEESYEIVFDTQMTIQLNGILPIINNSIYSVNITIGNSDPNTKVSIDGNNRYPGFFIANGNVTIQNMIFQNLIAQGGNGGNGISGGGGGMGAGGAIFVPQVFLNGSNPTVTLSNVSINNCSAFGGNGGNGFTSDFTGNEGGGGGGGMYAGNGGSITAQGITGGAGGGGLGGNGGDVTLNTSNPEVGGGGGGGGGGIGSKAMSGTPANLGNGGSDVNNGQDGNGYGLSTLAGSGAGGNAGGTTGGGGGGGNSIISAGGGGGGSVDGVSGFTPKGNAPPGDNVTASPSGGNGSDGGGGGGAGLVRTDITNHYDGSGGNGGYAGGGGGAAGAGAYDTNYQVVGGIGGVGGGGGGGGCNYDNATPAPGGNSAGGGGGGGGGPTNGSGAEGGSDQGQLGGGSGGYGSSAVGEDYAGGGGGGGSGLGGAIFIDSGLNFFIQALSGIPTIFGASNNTVAGGDYGTAGSNASHGAAGSNLGECIFLRKTSSLNFIANDANDLLTLSEGVSFVDDTSFGGTGTSVFFKGNGTIIYNGSTDYQGTIWIFNANLKLNGSFTNSDTASLLVCRSLGISEQRGTLSGSGSVACSVFVNSGTIYPDANRMLSLGSLQLNSADPLSNTLGSLTRITINQDGPSLVAVNGTAQLAGILEIDVDSTTLPGAYFILNSSGITGTFDSVQVVGGNMILYEISYLPQESPTYVQVVLKQGTVIAAPTQFLGVQKNNNFGFEYELYNQLTWKPSVSSGVVGYFLYRDGKKIATLDASAFSYQDHNRPRGVATQYSLIAFNRQAVMSTPVTITVA